MPVGVVFDTQTKTGKSYRISYWIMLWIVPPVVHPRGQSKSQSSTMRIIQSTGQ